jgi:peptidoglycan hydrolase FlgJ
MMTTNVLQNAQLNLKNPAEQKLKRFNEKIDNNFKDSLKKEILNRKDRPIDEKLMKTCIEMESIFVAKMLKTMRETVHKTKWIHGGHAEEIFEDMLYDKYSLKVSENSNLGIAKSMYNQLSQKI